MKVILDIENKVAEAPYELKELIENQEKLNKRFGRKADTSLSSLIDLSEYKVVYKQNRVRVDKTNAKMIDEFMESVKDNDKDLYKAYVELKNKSEKTSKNGKPIKTNFLTIKKWFYKNYPQQNPLRSE